MTNEKEELLYVIEANEENKPQKARVLYCVALYVVVSIEIGLGFSIPFFASRWVLKRIGCSNTGDRRNS
ncbi:cytochrome c oxidase VIIc family protein [Shouchella tritolerans]|uniref:cytochrome c oxidase VIIc family protein n=1 Tax=Shouchella tritolerans TaxID=2979466 RepID=UPI0021E922F8|nr:cytochrome c oxidase VIIc family protein [Shouchella tritolerans]